MSSTAASRDEALVYGVFKAMGDLLSAAAVVRKQLDLGYRVHLLVFPGQALKTFISLLDFGQHRDKLSVHDVPSAGGLFSFLKEMRAIKPKGVWISPHAPVEAASTKIPWLLCVTRALFWRSAVIAGADTEPGNRFFDVRVPVDRNLCLADREWAGFRLWRREGMEEETGRARFLPEIMYLREEAPRYDLLIHPGANAKNRSWPVDHFVETVKLLPDAGRVAVLGLAQEIEALRDRIPAERNVEFISGDLKSALMTIARARVLLSMDSGNVHFAKVLRVPTIAIFGKSDPVNIVGSNDIVTPIYERKFDCQPCGLRECSQPEVYCMNTVMPATVAAAIRRSLQTMSPLVQIASSHP